MAALGGGILAPAAENAGLDDLVKNSPFGQRTSDRPTTEAAGPLELRGVFVDHGEMFFSLYEPSSRISRWVGLNEPGNPFTVRSYDAAKGEMKVDYQGRSLSLGLKQAKVVALQAPPPPPAGQLVQPANGAAPAANPAVSTDEAARLAQVAEEIRRRRALRQQALQTPPPPAPPK